MKQTNKEQIIIALGGSIIYPSNINWKFLKKFKQTISFYIKERNRFIFVVGGGKLCRNFQKAALKIAELSDEENDWLGIQATRLNAELLKTIFKELAYEKIVNSPEKIKKTKKPIIIASGWKPGWSTDYVAMAIAKTLNIKRVIIAGKPDHVYDKDYNVFPDAKPFDAISWKEYRKLIPKKWIPGFNSPVDPIAAHLAEKSKIKAIIINGKNLENFEHLLGGKKFEGTIIQ